jgi:hypothetical protein
VSNPSRHWLMLRMIPSYKRNNDTASIESLMERQCVTNHRRTILRGLEKHSDVFPLFCDGRDKLLGWMWCADALSFDIPAMSQPAAPLYRMAGTFHSEINSSAPLPPCRCRAGGGRTGSC